MTGKFPGFPPYKYHPGLLDTGIRLFYFDKLCQLAYMIITNANGINILSKQQAAGNIGYFLLTIPRRVLQRFQDP